MSNGQPQEKKRRCLYFFPLFWDLALTNEEIFLQEEAVGSVFCGLFWFLFSVGVLLASVLFCIQRVAFPIVPVTAGLFKYKKKSVSIPSQLKNTPFCVVLQLSFPLVLLKDGATR